MDFYTDSASEKAQAQHDPGQEYGDPTEEPYQPKGNTPIGYLQHGICQEDILLGDGFLERGSAGLLAGPSGIGKSSIAMQMGCCLGCGRTAFDISPPRQLRIVMMQHEDSRNDLVRQSELARSLSLDPELIHKNFWIETVRGKIGYAAVKVMRELVKWWRADLLLLNPLSAYHDGDISQNKDNVKFLYGELGALLDELRIGLFGFHHKGKPPKTAGASHKEDVYFEIMYDILGGSVLTNFFRAIMTVSPIANSEVFRFTVAKRFEESGWPMKNQQFKWHEDRTKRLWVPASVAETEKAKATVRKTVENLRALVPATGDPIPRTTLENKACKDNGFTRQAFRAVLDEARLEMTPDELRLYNWSIYNPNGGPIAAIGRLPQPEDEKPDVIKERRLETKRKEAAAVKEAKRREAEEAKRQAKIVRLPPNAP
jgi:hypothetical protein